MVLAHRAREEPGPHRFWKRRRILSLAAHLYGRTRRCYRLAVRQVPRTYLRDKLEGRQRKFLVKKIWETRLNAACLELKTDFPSLKKTMNEVGIGLDRKTLQHLAIWEPRSFRGLARLTRAKTEVQGLNTLERPPDGVITRGMI